jgi:hypothetical protein
VLDPSPTQAPAVPTPPRSVMSRDNAEAAFAALDAAPALIDQVTSSLKRALADQLNEVLDSLRQAKEPYVLDDILAEDRARDFGRACEAAFAQIAVAAHHRHADLGPAFEVVDARLGLVLRRRLAASLSMADGTDRRVRDLYREIRRDRVEGIATAAAYEAFVAAACED